MKQACLLALTICLTILCGCSKSAKCEEKFTGWKTVCLAASGHSIEAEVTASDDDKVCEYTLLYTQNAEGETVRVIAPELIADITARISDKEVSLSYDGAILDTGSALKENLSPLMALPTLMKVIEEGHLENSWSETKDGTELNVTELEMPDGTEITLWQSGQDMTPVYADVTSSGKVRVKIEITKFENTED
ncbi:MAG: hypothetical protein VB064_00745 [Oscillospiraceae bacterium]|nr:hypothetical protein [Oscillospiraceae bacterium]